MTISHSHILEFDLSTQQCVELRVDGFLPQNNKIYWVHCDLTCADDFQKLASLFKLPEFLNQETTADVVDSGDDLLLQIQVLLSHTMAAQESILIIFITRSYIFTATGAQLLSIDDVRKNCYRNIKYAASPGFILFLLFESIMNDYSRVFQEYELVADAFDLQTREVKKGEYNEIMGLKKQVTKIKHQLAVIRDVLMRISGRKIAVITEPCRQYLENLFNHSQVIINEADVIREVLDGNLEVIKNSIAAKTSSLIRILTAISAIFLPLSTLFRLQEMKVVEIQGIQIHYEYIFLVFMIYFAVLIYIVRRTK